ncbi:conserved hypothetical protein [Flavobacterium sp. 9AF]|uniref:DUF262 domain-containing protein n=1 Tax=Flavobacterium sp. 9AF TaxID=2653142 RepID=UPI0012F32624|nr:DUF262 domain-containing protein [Flavobacterium sp. 9AF]VXC19581.1 conserved hypothetical protein [Flavobacterium sp. 9AF]
MSSKLKIDTRVRSLKNYLEEFEQGVFQIPSFQRDFLWTQDDIKQLFDSIKNNYPIGSILFWKPLENASSWIEESRVGPYRIKNRNEKDPIYILDGFQRLSSLFGCLTNPEKFNKDNLEIDKIEWYRNFNLFYDLEEEQFTYLRSSSNNQAYQVPVYVFMNSIDFRQYARKNFESIIDENKIEKYYDRADEIGQVFTNYQIASVDINYANIEEAVEIFWRVNAKGMLISKDWIASALTNKGDFRLGTEIDKLLEELKIYNFERLKRDIIFQSIQSSYGRIYFDYKIEELVKREDFIDVTKRTLASIKRAVKFLFEDLLVLNSKLIPYNAQLIFLTIFFNSLDDNNPTENQILSLKRWFWITSYSNYFTIYSLSNQRKAFEKFNQFILDERVDPIFNDNENNSFSTGEFPLKIYMGSVRAKSLAIFMINHSKGINKVSLDKINVEDFESFEFGNLFSIPQKDNPSENIIPIIKEFKFNNGNMNFKLLGNRKRQKNYKSLLNKENDKLFITSEMVKHNDGSEISEELILELRREAIVKAEKKFVESLDVFYNEPLNF